MGTRSLLSPKIIAKMTGTLRNTLTDTSVASVAHPNLDYTMNLADGIGAEQADRAWQYSGTLENAHQIIFDLHTMTGVDIGVGAALDGVGQAVDFENIVSIAIVNDNTSDLAGQLEIFPSHIRGWTPIGTHTVAVGGALKGQGILLKAQPAEGGFDVDKSSSHRITLNANGGPVDYSIYIFARETDYETSSESSSSSVSSVSSSSVSTSSSSVSTSSVSTSSVSSVSSSSSSSSSVSSSSSSSSSESSSSISVS
jgi:hypothetical protein